MSDKNCVGTVPGASGCTEAVCIHTSKVYDQCKSKECIRNLRVYLPAADHALINNASVTVKPRTAELLHTNIDVEKIQFHRGFYTVDIRFYYRITVEICTGVGRPTIIDGLAIYDKRCILFGSEGSAHIFSSAFYQNAADPQFAPKNNMPKAIVEVLDPLLLDARICSPSCCCCGEVSEVPPSICRCFQGEALDLRPDGNVLVVTLGQFSIIRLERDIQLMIPALNICMPDKDCSCNSGIGNDNETPCELFDTFEFPVHEFFPPQKSTCGCGNKSSDINAMTTVDCGCTSTCEIKPDRPCGGHGKPDHRPDRPDCGHGPSPHNNCSCGSNATHHCR